MHRKALGRGLDALIPAAGGTATMEPPSGVRELPVSDIKPNPFQPRVRFDDAAIRELAESIKEAKAYRTLAESAGLTHDRISERVGKQRVSITNSLRLLELPPEVQDMVSRGTLSAGHARALLSLDSHGDQLAAARYIQTRGF